MCFDFSLKFNRCIFSLIFDRFLSISTTTTSISITPLINIAVEGCILAGYALLPAVRIEQPQAVLWLEHIIPLLE